MRSRAQAQTLTSDLLRPVPDGFITPQDSPLRRTSENTADKTGDAAGDDRPRDKDTPRAVADRPVFPTYGLPAASGASDSGYDSLNRTRKKPKFYPGQARPKPPPGPGSPAPATVTPGISSGRVRLSIPPSETANKAPIPPAMAGTVDGQPPRKRLKIDDDPFGAVGDYAGSFLVKSAVELRGGYDTNPGRLPTPAGAPFWVVAPEFLAVSDWERHALVADLRGSFTGYGNSLPADRRRRDFAGADHCQPAGFHRPHRRPSRRHRRHPTSPRKCACASATDNPGSPNIQAGLASYPIYTTLGGTLGFDQRFNRLRVFRRRHRRPHRLSELDADRRHHLQQ